MSILFTSIETPDDAKDVAKRLIERDVKLFDTETTGISKEDEVWSLAIVDANGHPHFSEKFKPTLPMSRGAFKVHGVSNWKLRHESPYVVYHDRILHVMDGQVMMAYNVSFDVRLLKQTMHRYNCESMPNSSVTCLMKLYGIYSGQTAKKVTMESAVKQMRLGSYAAHDALADARMSAELLQAIAAGEVPDLEIPVKFHGEK